MKIIDGRMGFLNNTLNEFDKKIEEYFSEGRRFEEEGWCSEKPQEGYSGLAGARQKTASATGWAAREEEKEKGELTPHIY